MEFRNLLHEVVNLFDLSPNLFHCLTHLLESSGVFFLDLLDQVVGKFLERLLHHLSELSSESIGPQELEFLVFLAESVVVFLVMMVLIFVVVPIFMVVLSAFSLFELSSEVFTDLFDLC